MPLLIPPAQRSIVVIGKENTGKSQLVASLTGCLPYSMNFRGSTIAREQSLRFALALMGRQATVATCFSLILAWGGY